MMISYSVLGFSGQLKLPRRWCPRPHSRYATSDLEQGARGKDDVGHLAVTLVAFFRYHQWLLRPGQDAAGLFKVKQQGSDTEVAGGEK